VHVDAIAIWTLVFTFIAALAAVAGLFIGLRGLYYAKRGPTKEDIAHVTREVAAVKVHTAGSEGHLAELRKQDNLRAKAARVSIIAEGSAWNREPLDVNFSLEDSAVKLRRIDMLNRHGFPLGTLECREVTPARSSVTIDADTLSRWREEGNSLGLATRVTVRLRAYLEIGGEETDKEFSITTYESFTSMPKSDRHSHFMQVSGGC
jgi:hypothetical protein